MKNIPHLFAVLAVTLTVTACNQPAQSPELTVEETTAHNTTQEKGAASVSVSNAWIRMVPSVSANSGGFLTLTNNTDTAIKLINAYSDIAENTELHTMQRLDNGAMHMKRIPFLLIEAHSTQTLAPGGNHIMFISLKSPLHEGDTANITLDFDNAPSQVINMPVRSMQLTTAPMMDKSAHEHQH